MSTTGRLARYGWSVVSWIVLSGLVTGIAAALYYYQRAEDELRRAVETRLAEIYPELSIHVGSARIVQGEGIRLGQISIVRPDNSAAGRRSELAYAEMVTLRCDPSLTALLQRRLAVQQIICEGLTLHVERDVRGRWNLAELVPAKPLACPSATLPQIVIRNANWQFRDTRDGATRALTGDDVNLRIRLKRLTAQAGPSPTAATLPQVLVALDGSFRTPFCERIEVEGVARTTDGAWSLRGQAGSVRWSPDLVGDLPSILASRLTRLARLRARADIQFQLGRKSSAEPLSYQLDGRVREASWQDAGWPEPLANISCDLHVDPAGFQVRQLEASFGAARLAGEFRVQGHNLAQPFALDLTLDRFPLRQALVQLLPPTLQAAWRKFQAEGLFSGQLHLMFDGRQHEYEAELTADELSFLHYKFPYRVGECRGSLRLNSEVCQFDLVGLAGGTPITLRGAIRQPGPGYTGWWEAKTTRWKAIDDELIAAMPPKVGDLIRRLQLRGNAGFWVRQQRDDPQRLPPPDVVVALDQAWVNYDAFPYPIGNIQGRIEARGGRWTFREFEGWNDNCRILCDGYWDPTDASQPLELKFRLSNLGLDGELKQALPTSAQQIWAQLLPQGRLDQVDVQLFQTNQLTRPELEIRMVHGDPANPREAADGLQLSPTWFPLRMSNVQGEVRLRGSSLVLRGVTGEHGAARFRTNGSGELLPDGRWSINLTNLTVDRLELTEAVLRALPAPLAGAITSLGLGGTFALAGAMRFERDEPATPVASSWDLQLNVEQGRLQRALPMVGVFGQVDFNGAGRGAQFWSRGRLQLDSLVSYGVQLTAVEGPFWLDSTRVIFGERVPRQTADQASRPLTASVYQGRASGNAEIVLNRERDFSVQLNVTSADVASMARDWQLGQGNLAGQAYLELFLTGSNRGRQALRGNGTAQLRNANLYELPLILALLSRIGSGKTDNTAFSSSDIAFHISDDYVYFDRFDLAGDAITLKGIGEMSLERQLSLDFYSIVGREQFWNPLVRPFLGEASRQFLLIHVDGTLSNPRTTQEVLPGLNETLQQLFPELTAATTANRQVDERPRPGPLGLLPRWR